MIFNGLEAICFHNHFALTICFEAKLKEFDHFNLAKPKVSLLIQTNAR